MKEATASPKDAALRLALEAFNELAAWNDGEVGSHMDEPYSAEVAREAITAIKAALEAKDELVCVCGAVWEGQELVIAPQEEAKDEIDWKDMYEKQKRRSEMWVAKYEKDIGPLEKAVPQQEAKDEPVAWIEHHKGGDNLVWDDPSGERTPLYTTPQQRTWHGLTNEQFLEACQMAEGGNYMVAFQRIQQWLMDNNT